MVVLSAAVVSKSKTLIARQFVEMTKIRIEGLLSAFLKLIEKGGKDHTYIETESVRYVYQPMEEEYVLLITNKQSNILEDLETLRLLALIVQDNCEAAVTEESVIANAFNIIFAFDEAISFGYRECVSMSQIKAYTEMDSHEEKLEAIIRQNKENEEKERRKQIAMRLDKERAKLRREKEGGRGDNMLINEMKRMFISSPPSDGVTSMPAFQETAAYVNTSSSPSVSKNDYPGGGVGGPGGVPSKGMQLGKKKSPVEPIDSLRPSVAAGGVSPYGEEAESAVPATPVNPLMDPVSVLIEEKITGSLQTEGGLEEMDIQGTFQVTVHDVSKADLAAFKITPESKVFRFRVHPNLNKTAQTSKNILELKDATRAFRANMPSPLLKWRLTSTSEEYLPLNVSCWPSTTADGITLAVELELANPQRPLQDVHLQFMCPSNFFPKVLNVEGGTTEHDGVTMHWRIPVMDDQNSTGTLEMAARTDISTILPFTLEAVCPITLCDVDVLECYHQERNEPIKFGISRIARYSFTVGAQ